MAQRAQLHSTVILSCIYCIVMWSVVNIPSTYIRICRAILVFTERTGKEKEGKLVWLALRLAEGHGMVGGTRGKALRAGGMKKSRQKKERERT